MPDIAPQVTQINMNGLRGQMRRWAKPRAKKQFLVLYDWGGSLERIDRLARIFYRFGTVTAVDMPGMGGMDAFRSIHRKPTMDAYAEYIAAFITLRYRRSRVTIVAQPFSFAAVTRMLQHYPKLAERIDRVVSWGGFAHYDDLMLDSRRRHLHILTSHIGSSRLAALLLRSYYLRPAIFYRLYPTMLDSGRWLNDDVTRWRESRRQDIRSSDMQSCVHAFRELMVLDNCRQRLDTPLLHVITPSTLCDEHRVDQHLRVAYRSVSTYRLGPKGAVPTALRRVLTRS